MRGKAGGESGEQARAGDGGRGQGLPVRGKGKGKGSVGSGKTGPDKRQSLPTPLPPGALLTHIKTRTAPHNAWRPHLQQAPGDVHDHGPLAHGVALGVGGGGAHAGHVRLQHTRRLEGGKPGAGAAEGREGLLARFAQRSRLSLVKALSPNPGRPGAEKASALADGARGEGGRGAVLLVL